MAKILFVHNGVPGRFTWLAHALMAKGHQCALVNDRDGLDIPGVPRKNWTGEAPKHTGIFKPAVRAELDLRRGYAAAQEAKAFISEGFEPDLIIGHPGWGEMIFLREVCPKAAQIQIGEFYYRSEGTDFNFDPEFPPTTQHDHYSVFAKNTSLALSYGEADWIVAPTPFQGSTLPRAVQSRVRVIHEGIDVKVARKIPDASAKLERGVELRAGDPIITFINRRFEPLRGFHTFMRALPGLLKEVPEARVLIVGEDDPRVYGARAPNNKSWKQFMLDELKGKLDLGRVHFLGTLSYNNLIGVLSLSAAHVYYTYPFVLSWSLLDAMACECLLVASDTAPVRDVIRGGENGLMLDFFDPEQLSRTLISACREPGLYAPIRKAARETVIKEYDRATICQPMWLDLVDETLAARQA
ncbi:MAG: glycosyltransferase [Alphaproteobacteria bacterium]|nr:glycosyltransferase [Alphaproteobacteria bacterium]